MSVEVDIGGNRLRLCISRGKVQQVFVIGHTGRRQTIVNALESIRGNKLGDCF